MLISCFDRQWISIWQFCDDLKYMLLMEQMYKAGISLEHSVAHRSFKPMLYKLNQIVLQLQQRRQFLSSYICQFLYGAICFLFLVENVK